MVVNNLQGPDRFECKLYNVHNKSKKEKGCVFLCVNKIELLDPFA